VLWCFSGGLKRRGCEKEFSGVIQLPGFGCQVSAREMPKMN
jgi:hypothetical protein